MTINSNQSTAGLVQRFIGSDMDAVREVAGAIPEIVETGQNVPLMQEVIDNMDDINQAAITVERAEAAVLATEADAVQTAKDAETSTEAAAEAQLWATGSNPDGNEPSDTYNAMYFAELSKGYSDKKLTAGGTWDPSIPDNEYPNVTKVTQDTLWLINLSGDSEYYEYVSGPFAGKTVANLDAIYYNDSARTFELISNPTALPQYVVEAVEFTDVEGQATFDIPPEYIGRLNTFRVEYNGASLATTSYSIAEDFTTFTLLDTEGAESPVDDAADVVTLLVWNLAGSTDLAAVEAFVLTSYKNATRSEEQAIVATEAAELATEVARNLVAELLNVGGNDVGDYEDSVPLESFNDFAVHNRANEPTMWKVKAGTSLPYAMNPAAYPNPIADPRIQPFNNDVTELEVVAHAQNTVVANVAYLQLGTIDEQQYFLDPAYRTVYCSDEPIKGEITDLELVSPALAKITVEGEVIDLVSASIFNQRPIGKSLGRVYVGNISDFVGGTLTDAEYLNSYQYPDDSNEWYGPTQSQTFPITIPADPTAAGSGWILVSAGLVKVTATGSTTPRSLSDRFADVVNVRDFGDGSTDDGQAIRSALAVDGTMELPTGNFLIDDERAFSSIKPMYIKGNGFATNVHVGDNNTDNTAFRLEAVGGGNFGRPAREMSKFQDLNFTGVGKTAIDAQAVFPLILDTVRFEHMGAAALKMYQCYYGRASNMYFVGSGVDFDNVNNFTISGGDSTGDTTNNTLAPTDYANRLYNCDRVTFDDMTFEGHPSRIFDIIDGKNINFVDVWWEGNLQDHLIKLTDTVDVNFTRGWLELGPSPTSAFILVEHVDSTGILNGREFMTTVNVTDAEIRYSTHITGDTEYRFIKTTTDEKVNLILDKVTVRVGYLRNDPTVFPYLSRIQCPAAGTDVDDYVFLEAMSEQGRTHEETNTWCTDSGMPDWDFASGNVFDQEGGSDIVFTKIDKATSPEHVYSGTNSLKCVLPADGTSRTIKHSSQVGAIVDDAGTTYSAFLRIKTSEPVEVSIGIDGAIINCFDSKVIKTKATEEWTDYFMKAGTAVAQNAGQHGNPKLFIKVTNNTGNVVDLYIDRGDMQKCKGSIFLP
ncbi:hypothetical protein OAP32_00540 [Crocinitomicaceae bacterium]|nr:hypothetical protein [Crocinitomicaceae bacterium]